ncbi:MAG: SDR family NAD(P)-dependent oxidoreductase [Rhodobacteraceae bacterium]|nr:SDR family NAD(P)-dependent oxidoreductase [Paracoccaceae bacterium]
MNQKTILITGCSSGIGYDAALGLRARGWQVFASCRKPEDCQRLQNEGFTSPLIDYRDTNSIAAGLAQVLETTGGTLDALFNNGAHGFAGAVEDLPTDGLREIFESNFFGWHELTRQVVPVMRAQGSGRIVQCSSGLGLVTIPWRGAYSATKFALEALSDTMRVELRGTGIRVILIEPGPITTAFRKNSIAYFEKWIDWENSPRRVDYEAKLRPRMYGETKPEKFELPASAVTAKLIHALESSNPNPRYYVTTPTYISGILRRVLSTRMMDAITSRI